MKCSHLTLVSIRYMYKACNISISISILIQDSSPGCTVTYTESSSDHMSSVERLSGIVDFLVISVLYMYSCPFFFDNKMGFCFICMKLMLHINVMIN